MMSQILPMGSNEEGFSNVTVRCVLFQLGSEVYGINVKKIREVLRVGQVRDVPGAKNNVVGVINVRGVIVTVVDGRGMYHLPAKQVDGDSRIVIVEVDDDTSVGVMVDRVLEVKDIPESCVDLMAENREGRSAYIQGVAHYQDNVIVLVDTDVMFSAAK